MERLFEATKLVDVSLSKLNRNIVRTEMPLRRSLLLNRVLHRAKEVAITSEQLMDFSTDYNDLESSRLFATMNSTRVDEPRPPRVPLASIANARRDAVVNKLSVCRKEPSSQITTTAWSDSERMETEITNHNSVLSEILCCTADNDAAALMAPSCEEELQDNWSSESDVISPGKRKTSDRYPWTNNEQGTMFQFDDQSKRFKQSTQHSMFVWSDNSALCLSPSNVTTAPFIAYMLGTGFNAPSGPAHGDWPELGTSAQWLSPGHHADLEMPQAILVY